MKRIMLALALLTGLAVAGSSFADNLGRATIRTAADEQPMAKPAAPAAPATTGPVVSTGTGCASGNCPHCGWTASRAVQTGDARVGLLPDLKNMFVRSGCGMRLCKKCGGIFGGRGCEQQQQAFNPYPNGVPGTLVFPQHPFVRSPRDFFMWEPK